MWYELDKIDYIKLSGEYWMTIEEFNKLTQFPTPLAFVDRGSLNSWYGLWDFAVVFKNGDWLSYNYNSSDPYYSKFELHKLPKKPQTEYKV